MPYHGAPTSRCNAPAAEGTDRRTGGGTRPRASLAGQTWRTGRRNDGRMRRTRRSGIEENGGPRGGEGREKRAMLPLGLDLFLSLSFSLFLSHRPRVFGPRECRGTPRRGGPREGVGRGLALWAPQGLSPPSLAQRPLGAPSTDERTNERPADRWPSVYASCY